MHGSSSKPATLRDRLPASPSCPSRNRVLLMQAEGPTIVVSTAEPANFAVMCTNEPVKWYNMAVRVETAAGKSSGYIDEPFTTPACT